MEPFFTWNRNKEPQKRKKAFSVRTYLCDYRIIFESYFSFRKRSKKKKTTVVVALGE